MSRAQVQFLKIGGSPVDDFWPPTTVVVSFLSRGIYVGFIRELPRMVNYMIVLARCLPSNNVHVPSSGVKCLLYSVISGSPDHQKQNMVRIYSIGQLMMFVLLGW